MRRLQQVCDISFDSDGHLVLGPDGLRPLGGPLPAAPGEAWRVIWIDDGGAAREWADRVPGAEGAIGATVGERFCELQATARHVKYMLQRMQVDVSIWFLLERPMEHRSLPPPPPPAVEAVAAVAAAENGRLPMPPYWQLARALRAETAHTWLGATQALAAHVVFVLSEPMAMLYFCSTFYYARMKDRGVTDLGVGGTTQVPPVPWCDSELEVGYSGWIGHWRLARAVEQRAARAQVVADAQAPCGGRSLRTYLGLQRRCWSS